MTDVAVTTPQTQQPANNTNVNSTNVNNEMTPPFFLLSKTEIVGLLKIINDMKAKGVPATDPNYVALTKVIKAQQQLLITLQNMTPEQREQLKAQQQAYRHLTRNVPAPEDALKTIKKDPETQIAKPATPAKHVSTAPVSISNNGVTLGLIPMDAAFVIQERENRIQNRMKQRLEELRVLYPMLPEEMRVDALIEIKQLELFEMQKRMRANILEEFQRTASSLQSASDRALYKRPRTFFAPEVVPTERTERQKREDQQVNKARRRNDLVSAVTAHARAFKDFHANNNLLIKKVNKQVVKYVQNKEKKEQLQRERDEKERLQALKANDEDAYIKLLEKAKNDRLKTILEQTDKYLKEIGAAVEREQETIDGVAGPVDAEMDEDAMLPTNKKRGNQTYYMNIHKIKEEITEQPSILIGGKLKEYQMAGLSWLVSLYNNRMNGILADEMGLGKTIQTISLLCYLFESKGMKGPFMVVAPLATISNWSGEFERWAPVLEKIIFRGTPAQRKQLYQHYIQPGKFNVLLTTFEYVIKEKAMLAKVKWNYIIIDEGHRMKNHDSKLTTTLQKHYSAQHRLILTGTPLQNNLPELWSLLNYLLPNIFNSVNNFEQWFNAPFATTGEKVEMTEEESLLVINRLHKVLRPFLLRRLKKQVESQLPDKVEKVLKCDMSAWQRKIYDQLLRGGSYSVQDAEGKISTKGLMNSLMQLRKICNHPYLFLEDNWEMDDNLWRVSGKFELLDKTFPKLKAAGHRVLLFTQMVSVMTLLEDYFNLRGYMYLRLDGSTKGEDRGSLLAKFNAPDSPYFIFILSTRAGGLGLNLQTADTVVIFDSDWNPQMDLQAQDRAHRIGQKNEVRVFRLITIGSVEENILARANYKLDIDQKIIEAGMFHKDATQADRQQFLMSLLKKTKEDDEEQDFVPTDEQINQMLARSDEEFALFEQLDKERTAQEEAEWMAKGNSGPPRPRLMQEHELPDWLKVDLEEMERQKEASRVEYGRGRRARSNVNYDLEMSDREFYKMITDENEDDGTGGGGGDIGSRRAKRKREQQEDTAGYLDLEDSNDGSAAPVAKRARTEAPQSVAYNNNTNVNNNNGGVNGEKKEKSREKKLNRSLRPIWKAVKKAKDETGRSRSKIFMDLPSRELYPDYFQYILQPICMKDIKKKHYTDAQQFYADFMLMFRNAQQYNMPGSIVYEDSLVLQQLVQGLYSDYCAQNPGGVSEGDKKMRHSKKGKPEESSSATYAHPTTTPFLDLNNTDNTNYQAGSFIDLNDE